MTRLHRLILFFLVFLHVSNLNAQEEKQDSVGTEVKRVMTRVTDGLVTGVRYTEDKLKEVGKQINAIDTNYISPNLYNLFSIRSITQLVVVALKPSQVQMLLPCKCSTTA